jgi:hypothetical protein
MEKKRRVWRNFPGFTTPPSTKVLCVLSGDAGGSENYGQVDVVENRSNGEHHPMELIVSDRTSGRTRCKVQVRGVHRNKTFEYQP